MHSSDPFSNLVEYVRLNLPRGDLYKNYSHVQ